MAEQVPDGFGPILRALVRMGLPLSQITVTDILGVVYQGRLEEMDADKARFAIDTPARTLADDMLAQKDVAALPSADDPSLVLDDPAKRNAVEQAYSRIAPMFWGPRIPLNEACGTLRDWVAAMRG